MSVYNPYLVLPRIALTTSARFPWFAFPAEIQNKILQYTHSSYTVRQETIIPVPFDLLLPEQLPLDGRARDHIPVTQEMTFKRVMILPDLTTELEISFRQTVTERPSRSYEPVDNVCDRLLIDKKKLYAKIQDIKTWSEISKIKMSEGLNLSIKQLTRPR
jgi:hypothetical protein